MTAPTPTPAPPSGTRRCRRPLLVGVAAGLVALVASTIVPAGAARAPVQKTAAPTAATSSPWLKACGSVVTKANGRPWVCTFADEFDGKTLNTKRWVIQQTATSGYHSGAECFVTSSRNVSVGRGLLSLTVRKEASPFTCSSPLGSYQSQYTSGMVSTSGLFSQAYGRFEIRARVPATAVRGLQTAFWLWPADAGRYGPAWPASGEIDIAEMYSQYPDRAVPFVHYATATVDATITNTQCLIKDLGRLHTYAVEWTPTQLTVVYDGVPCLVHRWNPAFPLVGSQPFDQPFLVVLTHALGIGTNAFDPAITPLPATTQVDYVRVWK